MNTSIQPQPRGVLSTTLVTFFGTFVAGFLWIGRPKLAVMGLLLTFVLIGVIYIFGAPSLGHNTRDIVQWSGTAISIASVLFFRRSSVPRGWYSNWFAAIAVAFLVMIVPAVAVRSLVVQPFSSPSGSMVPTLFEGDTFFVSKSAFGYSRHSFPFGIVSFEGRILPAMPVRGDIVVFKFGDGLDYVKRVIGMPGETIQMKNGVVFIDGIAVVQEPTGEHFQDEEYADAQILIERLPNGVSYKILDIEPDSALDNTREYQVPEGHFFVLGDNRDNSSDSRVSVGFVPLESLVGRADRIFANIAGREYRSRKNLRPTPASAD